MDDAPILICEFVEGSVSHEVAKHPPVPVLVLPPQTRRH
jgi:hypothetical protein